MQKVPGSMLSFECTDWNELVGQWGKMLERPVMLPPRPLSVCGLLYFCVKILSNCIASMKVSFLKSRIIGRPCNLLFKPWYLETKGTCQSLFCWDNNQPIASATEKLLWPAESKWDAGRKKSLWVERRCLAAGQRSLRILNPSRAGGWTAGLPRERSSN